MERRLQSERQQFKRYRRGNGGDELVRGGDDYEALGGGGHHLLARVRTAATLDQPASRRDLVGSVDRKIEAAEAREGADVQPVLARYLLGGRGGGHVDNVLQRPCGEDWQQPSNRRAGAEADPHPLGDKLRRCFGRRALLALD